MDTGCSSTIANTEFALALPDVVPQDAPHPVNVSGIGSRHVATRYVKFAVYFPGRIWSADREIDDAFARITVRAYLVDGLKTHLLVGTDVIAREGFLLDFDRRIATIRSCGNLTIPITVQAKKDRLVSAPVYASKRVVVPPHHAGKVPVKVRSRLPTERDLMFEPTGGMTG